MKVTMVTDEQIRDFNKEASRLDELLKTTFHRYEDYCYLTDYWDGIHYLLTGAAENSELPLSALKKGDVAFSNDVDFSKRYPESTHVIYSSTVKTLAAELYHLTESTLRQRFDKPRMLELNVYPGRLWLFPDREDSSFRELMFYYSRLRDIVAKAAQQNKGLLFCRYEDW
jgi:hypothetical protein